MSVPVWCADLAAKFWAAAGDPPSFPRDLRPVIAGSVPLSVINLPCLRVATVCTWFASRGITIDLDEPDRPLRACLVARQGQGFAFLDAADDLAEQRFSLAHELGHFLRDYWHPRESAAARLGPTIRAILDGQRAPTAEERLDAILRNTHIGAFTHLLRRDESGRPLSPAEHASEVAADRLAFELLAPAKLIDEIGDRSELTTLLVSGFGLPPAPATRYAALMIPEPMPLDGLVGRLLSF